jgi:hypothetical protein
MAWVVEAWTELTPVLLASNAIRGDFSDTRTKLSKIRQITAQSNADTVNRTLQDWTELGAAPT